MGTEEKTEDLSSNIPLEVESEIECRLGETDADKVGGDPGGVSRGVVVWDVKRKLCDKPALEAAITIIRNKKNNMGHIIYDSKLFCIDKKYHM